MSKEFSLGKGWYLTVGLSITFKPFTIGIALLPEVSVGVDQGSQERGRFSIGWLIFGIILSKEV